MTIKNLALFLLVLAAALSGCRKGEGLHTPAYPSIYEWFQQQPDMTLLTAAIQRTRLDTIFSSGGPWTFFAATDSAFTAAGFTLDVIRRYDTAALGRILRYQVAPGKIDGSELYGFFSENLITLDTADQPYIIKNYYGIFLNGIKVIRPDIEAADGVIQVTGQLAIPPAGDMFAVVAQQPDLTYINSFLAHTRTIPDYLRAYETTFLAPCDSAWKAYGFATIDDFNQADTNVLNQLMLHCVERGPLFTPEFLGGFDLYSPDRYQHFNGIVSPDGLHLLNAGNSGGNLTPPAIIRPDIVAGNGVLDVLDQVYFPPN